jgi:hypothetical protein
LTRIFKVVQIFNHKVLLAILAMQEAKGYLHGKTLHGLLVAVTNIVIKQSLEYLIILLMELPH